MESKEPNLEEFYRQYEESKNKVVEQNKTTIDFNKYFNILVLIFLITFWIFSIVKNYPSAYNTLRDTCLILLVFSSFRIYNAIVANTAFSIRSMQSMDRLSKIVKDSERKNSEIKTIIKSLSTEVNKNTNAINTLVSILRIKKS